MIFDDCERTDESWGREKETLYDFYNRSAQPEAQRVRQLMESMLPRYPEGERANWVSRFRSRATHNFETASFELILHDTLHSLGCELTPHPQLDDSPKHPDFLVTTPCGNSFYLEAVSATEKRDRHGIAKGGPAQRDNAIAELVDALRDEESDSFWIHLQYMGVPYSRPSCTNLRKGILGWFSSLDPDEILKDEAGSRCSSWFCSKGLKVRVKAFARQPEQRGRGGRLLVFPSSGFTFVDKFNPIRKAIIKKGKAYRALKHPFLVAANVDCPTLDARAEVGVLFGQQEIVAPAPDQPDRESESRPCPNGVWLNEAGPQWTRVSGVWFFANLSIDSIATARQTIYFNPWATSALPDFLKQFPHAVVRDGNLCRHDGKRLATILGLPESQPMAETF
jgi:hypothetical protein